MNNLIKKSFEINNCLINRELIFVICNYILINKSIAYFILQNNG